MLGLFLRDVYFDPMNEICEVMAHAFVVTVLINNSSGQDEATSH